MNSDEQASVDELLQLFDGELSEEAAHSVQARLTDSQRATLTQWQEQAHQLKALGQSIASEPLPHDLLQASRRTDTAHASMQGWQRWGGMAASVLLAFGLGWFTRSVAPDGHSAAVAAAGTAARELHGFQGQAALAHVTFTPEVKHPVEVSAEQRQHLVQWLSKRLGRDLKLPDLSSQGYELMGGRLLPGDAGARAQFMFQKADGLRVTLYVGAVSATGSDASLGQDTGFAFSQHDTVGSFYWVDRGFGYALSAPLPKNELMSLAQTVFTAL